jgi:hypothetical protein
MVFAGSTSATVDFGSPQTLQMLRSLQCRRHGAPGAHGVLLVDHAKAHPGIAPLQVRQQRVSRKQTLFPEYVTQQTSLAQVIRLVKCNCDHQRSNRLFGVPGGAVGGGS